MDWLYWDRGGEWTGYAGTEQVNGLVILGCWGGEWTDYKCSGYTGQKLMWFHVE